MVPDKVGKDTALGDGREGLQRVTGQNYIQAVSEQKKTNVFTLLLLLSLSPISCSSDSTVTIYENAKGSSSTFKFHSFRFQRLEKVSTVWLHCEVQVCDGDRLVCQPVSLPLLQLLLFSPQQINLLTYTIFCLILIYYII